MIAAADRPAVVRSAADRTRRLGRPPCTTCQASADPDPVRTLPRHLLWGSALAIRHRKRAVGPQLILLADGAPRMKLLQSEKFDDYWLWEALAVAAAIDYQARQDTRRKRVVLPAQRKLVYQSRMRFAEFEGPHRDRQGRYPSQRKAAELVFRGRSWQSQIRQTPGAGPLHIGRLRRLHCTFSQSQRQASQQFHRWATSKGTASSHRYEMQPKPLPTERTTAATSLTSLRPESGNQGWSCVTYRAAGAGSAPAPSSVSRRSCSTSVPGCTRAGLLADATRAGHDAREIGSHLALTLESVRRAQSRMHEDGLLEVRQRDLRIADEKALRAGRSRGVLMSRRSAGCSGRIRAGAGRTASRCQPRPRGPEVCCGCCG